MIRTLKAQLELRGSQLVLQGSKAWRARISAQRASLIPVRHKNARQPVKETCQRMEGLVAKRTRDPVKKGKGREGNLQAASPGSIQGSGAGSIYDKMQQARQQKGVHQRAGVRGRISLAIRACHSLARPIPSIHFPSFQFPGGFYGTLAFGHDNQIPAWVMNPLFPIFCYPFLSPRLWPC